MQKWQRRCMDLSCAVLRAGDWKASAIGDSMVEVPTHVIREEFIGCRGRQNERDATCCHSVDPLSNTCHKFTGCITTASPILSCPRNTVTAPPLILHNFELRVPTTSVYHQHIQLATGVSRDQPFLSETTQSRHCSPS